MTKKTNFPEGLSWFKFNKLGLALGMAITFYKSEPERIKLKIRKF